MKTRFFIQSLLVSLLMLILAACVSVEGLYVAPSFTYQSLVSNNIGVGGVASASRDLRPGTQSAYANILRNAIIQHYPGMNVMPSGDLTRALNAHHYRRMMRYYGQYGVIPDQYLHMAHRHIAHMRYLVVARIVEDQVTHNRDQQAATKQTGASLTLTTQLSMSVALKVYDLRSGQIVWSGTVTESRSRDNHYSLPSVYVDHHKSAEKQIVAELANVALEGMGKGRYRYPASPSASNLLSDIFRGLLTKFPAPPKNKN